MLIRKLSAFVTCGARGYFIDKRPKKSTLLLEPTERNSLKKLENAIGYQFKNLNLLRQAITHRSYLNENRSWDVHHNERLELLGDAVLELAVTEYLFDTFPDKEEGTITQMRSFLVNAEKAAEVSQSLGVNDFLLLSRGEARNAKARKIILANAFEAIIGAIHLDGGIEESRQFINRALLSRVPKQRLEQDLRDAKSHLQEFIQSHLKQTPHYDILETSGPDHDKTFVIGVFIGEQLIAKGEGLSRLAAENAAADEAFNVLVPQQ